MVFFIGVRISGMYSLGGAKNAALFELDIKLRKKADKNLAGVSFNRCQLVIAPTDVD